ncbi:MAG TPA: hypothetical protein VGD79_12435 [Thermoanaerobaculia bacterium]|jgi:hypothetical protein
MGRILSLVLAAVLVPAGVSAQTLQHGGIAIDFNTRKAIDVRGSAYIRVFPSGDDCPAFKDLFLVDAETKSGTFRFFIDSKRKSYGTVFCANGYYSRVDPARQNLVDGSPVFSGPLYMIAKEDRETVGNAVGTTLDEFESWLRYLQSIDGDRFAQAVKDWSKSHGYSQFGEALLGLLAREPK